MANGKKSRFMRARIRQGTLFLIPTLILVLALIVAPLIYVFILSFHEWNGSKNVEMVFVGVQNYLKLRTMIGFKDMLVFTFTFAIAVTILTVGVALIVSFALDKPGKGRHVNRSFLRACWYVPALIGGVAVGVIWRIMYNYNNGVINSILTMLGLEKVNWLETYGVPQESP